MRQHSTPVPRVLIVTGDYALDRRIADMLAALRYSSQSAGDNAEALGILLDADPPEIALLGVNGLDIAAEVKRRRSAKQTWIILLTAANPSIIARAADSGVDDLLLCEPSAPDAPNNHPINEADLRIRLGVAARVQEMGRELAIQSAPPSSQKIGGVGTGQHTARDPLTGLWDRESLLALLFPETDRVQRMGTPLTLMLLDLDYFGRINDEYGVHAGDLILQELAARLRRYLRSYDLLGRSGGDEFLVALPGCTSEQALGLARRIRAELLHFPFAPGRLIAAGHDAIALTASIGLAQSRGRSPLVALREAERAVAMAKLDGRNCEREFPLPKQQEPPAQTTIQ